MKPHKGPSVTFNLSTVADEDLKSKLEMKYIEFETLKRMNVTATRDAMRAQANAIKAGAEVSLAQMDFLIQAAEAFDLINTEPIWMTRRSNNGDVILECLLTEKDMQRMAKAQSKQMKDQISEITGAEEEEEDPGDDGMFAK